MTIPVCDTRSDQSFPATQWKLIHEAADAELHSRRQAVDDLVRQYYRTLLAHLMFKKGLDLHQAEDMLQGFLIDKVLNGKVLQSARPERGRFRSLLLRALENYVIDRYRADLVKLARHSPPLSLEDHLGQPQARPEDDVQTPCEAKRSLRTFRTVLLRLQHECASSGRGGVWRVFLQRILKPLLHGAAPRPCDELAQELGWQSPAQVSNALATAKRGFQRILRTVLRESGTGESDLEGAVRSFQQDLVRCQNMAGSLPLEETEFSAAFGKE